VRAFVWKFYRTSQRHALETLQAKGVVDIAVWVGRSRHCNVNIDDLYALRFNELRYAGVAREYFDELYHALLPTFLDMFSRVPEAQTMSYQEQLNAFSLYYDYFARTLEEEKIELVLFNNMPHFGMDLILYHLAKKMGIKTLVLMQSHIPNRFYYMYDLEDYGVFENFPATEPALKLVIEKKYEKKHFYMAKIPLKFRSCGYNLLNEMRRIVFRRRSRMPFMAALDKYLRCRMFKRRTGKYGVSRVDFEKKFVYFPLHLQPELTTSALGGKYADQLLALEELSKMVPDDWLIYVKENPKQLQQQRDKFFFKRLNAIKNAVLVSSDVDTYALTGACQFVASIAGTVGWEAISGGKPTLIFGKVWYRRLPGVFEYSHGLSVDEIMACEIDHEELQREYNTLMNKTRVGVVDPAYATLVKDFSPEQNSEVFAASVEKILLDGAHG